MNPELIQYVNDPRTNQRRGVVIAIKSGGDGYAVGWSFTHKNDRFDKKTGVLIARGRAAAPPHTPEKLPRDIIGPFTKMFARAERYFKPTTLNRKA